MTAYQTIEALADPSRRAIFERLARCPMPVAALADGMPISRPAVSQHLKHLTEAGLVRARAEGTRRIYSVDPSPLAEVRRYFEQFWSLSLAAFVAAAENPTQEEK